VTCVAPNSGIVYINMGLDRSESGPATRNVVAKSNACKRHLEREQRL
jgi:hypothetical protein